MHPENSSAFSRTYAGHLLVWSLCWDEISFVLAACVERAVHSLLIKVIKLTSLHRLDMVEHKPNSCERAIAGTRGAR